MRRIATANAQQAGHARQSLRVLALALLASLLIGQAASATASASTQLNTEVSRCTSNQGMRVCINVWLGPTNGSTVYVAQVEGTVTNLTGSQTYGDYLLMQLNNGAWSYWITGIPNLQDPVFQMYYLGSGQTLSYLTADWAYKPFGTCFMTQWGPGQSGITVARMQVPSGATC